MHIGKTLLITPFLFAISACQSTPQASSTLATAPIHLANATQSGTASLVDTGGKVTLVVSLNGLAPGEHAMHLHTTGLCVTPDFQSAGAHLNPHGKQHGAKNPMGSHLGDLPNVNVDAAGKAQASVVLDGALSDLLPVLLDNDGTAIVIHAAPDDMVSDPAGNAGKRIACGEFRPG